LLQVTPPLSEREPWEPRILFIPIYPNARTTVCETVVLLSRPDRRTLQNQSERLLVLLAAVGKTGDSTSKDVDIYTAEPVSQAAL
jgi:hypothetical protein